MRKKLCAITILSICFLMAGIFLVGGCSSGDENTGIFPTVTTTVTVTPDDPVDPDPEMVITDPSGEVIANLDFGFTSGNERTLSIHNTGEIDLEITEILFADRSSSHFSSDTQAPFIIEPGEEKPVVITFTATEPGEYFADLTIKGQGRRGTVIAQIELYGMIPPVTVEYGDYILESNTEAVISDLWDLTKGPLTVSYTVDLTGIEDLGFTFNRVGMRTGSIDEVGPAYAGEGGWMSALYQSMDKDPNAPPELIWDHLLLDAGVNDDYPDNPYEMGYDSWKDPDGNVTIQTPFGSWNTNYFWYKRDLWPDGVGKWYGHDGQNYNTGGTYDVVIEYYYDEDSGRGMMFATVNGLPCGIFRHPDDWGTEPNWLGYPNIPGLSFDSSDFTSLQPFANYYPLTYGWVEIEDSGSVSISDLTVTGWPKE